MNDRVNADSYEDEENQNHDGNTNLLPYWELAAWPEQEARKHAVLSKDRSRQRPRQWIVRRRLRKLSSRAFVSKTVLQWAAA